ncbi:MAG: capsular polysaccharide synthesis protein [Planctomycetota bacterium]
MHSPRMAKIIWSYWENPPGGSVKPHVRLCRATLREHLGDCEFRLVTPDNLADYLPDLPANVHRIERDEKPGQPCIAIRAGVLRVFLLEKYGGMWLDADAVVLRSLDPVFDRLETHEFVGMRRTSSPRQHVVNNFFASRAGGEIITEYADTLRELVEQKHVFVWNEVGSFALTPIVDRQLDRVFLFPEKDVHPLVAGKQHFYMREDIEPDEVIDGDTLTFMLFHRIFDGENPRVGRGLLDATVGDLYDSDMLISKVLRRALPRDRYRELMSSAEGA